jgi:hypothetical protein
MDEIKHKVIDLLQDLVYNTYMSSN